MALLDTADQMVRDFVEEQNRQQALEGINPQSALMKVIADLTGASDLSGFSQDIGSALISGGVPGTSGFAGDIQEDAQRRSALMDIIRQSESPRTGELLGQLRESRPSFGEIDRSTAGVVLNAVGTAALPFGIARPTGNIARRLGLERILGRTVLPNQTAVLPTARQGTEEFADAIRTGLGEQDLFRVPSTGRLFRPVVRSSPSKSAGQSTKRFREVLRESETGKFKGSRMVEK